MVLQLRRWECSALLLKRARMYCALHSRGHRFEHEIPFLPSYTLCDAVFKLFRHCTLPACYFILLKLELTRSFPVLSWLIHDFSLLKALRRKNIYEYYRMGLTRRWRTSVRAAWNFSLGWKSSKQPSNMFLIRSRLHGHFQPGCPEWNSNLIDRWNSLKTALEITREE